MQEFVKNLLTPSGNIVGGLGSAALTILGGHVAVSYNYHISPDEAGAFATGAYFLTGHLWDVFTREPEAPVITQGTAPPPPAAAGYQPIVSANAAAQPPKKE